MNKDNILSIAYVGVYSKSLNMLPTFEPSFSKQLLGEAANSGFIPEGFCISIDNKPAPLIVISPRKIVVKANDKDTLLEYIDEIKKEFQDKNIELPNFVAFGINYECQFLKSSNSEEWLWSNLINSDIQIQNALCNKLSFKFGVKDNSILNMTIEPRVGRNDGLFINVNHHHNINCNGLPMQNELDHYCVASEAVLDGYIKKLRFE